MHLCAYFVDKDTSRAQMYVFVTMRGLSGKDRPVGRGM